MKDKKYAAFNVVMILAIIGGILYTVYLNEYGILTLHVAYSIIAFLLLLSIAVIASPVFKTQLTLIKLLRSSEKETLTKLTAGGCGNYELYKYIQILFKRKEYAILEWIFSRNKECEERIISEKNQSLSGIFDLCGYFCYNKKWPGFLYYEQKFNELYNIRNKGSRLYAAEYFDLCLMTADYYIQNQNFTDAHALTDSLLLENAKSAELYYIRGILYKSMSLPGQALENLKNACKFMKNKEKLFIAKVYLEIFRILCEINKRAEAKQYYDAFKKIYFKNKKNKKKSIKLTEINRIFETLLYKYYKTI